MQIHPMVKTFFTCLLVLAISSAYAQSKKKRKNAPQQTQQPTSVDPYLPKEDYGPPKRKANGKITYDAQKNFEKRREQVAKANRKAEKEESKIDKSGPPYFGHKRIPKKHAPDKMKFCKECGIRH